MPFVMERLSDVHYEVSRTESFKTTKTEYLHKRFKINDAIIEIDTVFWQNFYGISKGNGLVCINSSKKDRENIKNYIDAGFINDEYGQKNPNSIKYYETKPFDENFLGIQSFIIGAAIGDKRTINDSDDQ